MNEEKDTSLPLDYWDYSIELECLQGSQDLQLAAELGKTLLERNKELELALKQQQVVIEDQAQEIEYLTKQTVALREVSDSRLRIYEQLEISIQDLERTNHRLQLDKSADKKQIKTLTGNVESLEAKCEELQTIIDELKLEVDSLRRRSQKAEAHNDKHIRGRRVVVESPIEETVGTSPDIVPAIEKRHSSFLNSTPIKPTAPRSVECEDDANLEQISQLMAELRESKTQICRNERRITELEEQLATMVQQNQALENQIVQLHPRDAGMKSMFDEISTLEEVCKGEMCSRCLRKMERSSEPADEEDDTSMLNAVMASPSPHRTSFTMDIQDRGDSLYQDLVEKYEALLEVHRQPPKKSPTLHDELQMSSGEFSTHPKARTALSHTPTDFSEAETSSSGFSDETSNKATQTDRGSYLCTIGDGDEAFSIYNEADTMSSRFKNQPEYQQLFKEIFTVLKNTPAPEIIKKEEVQEVMEEELELMEADSQSVVSSTMSELSISHNEPTTVIENIIQSQNQPIPEPEVQERVLRPLVREPLEYLSVEVRKRSSSRRKNKCADRSDSPVTHIIGSPKINYSSRPNSGRRKRDFRNNVQQENDTHWNGSTLQFWSSRNAPSPTPSQGSGKFEFRPSLASQELHKLKKLDLSYAEVVRKADCKKQTTRQQRRRQ